MNQLVIGLTKKWLITEMAASREASLECESMTKASRFEDRANTLQEVLNEISKIEAEVITGITGKEMKV